MGGGDLLQLQLAPRLTKLGIKAIHQLFPRHPDLLGERERDRGSTDGNSTHKLILSPVLSQRRSQLEPSSSSSPPHRFTTTSPCWSSGCSRSRSCRPAVPEQRASGCLRAGGAGSEHGTLPARHLAGTAPVSSSSTTRSNTPQTSRPPARQASRNIGHSPSVTSCLQEIAKIYLGLHYSIYLVGLYCLK